MNAALLIYLVMTLDSIREIFAFITGVSSLLSLALLLFIVMCIFDNDTDNDAYRTISQWFKKAAPIALSSVVMFALIPSTKTAIYMVGGAGVVEVLQSEQAQEVGGKAYRLLMKKLDEELAE